MRINYVPGVVAFHPRATLPGKCNSNFPKENRGTERSRVLPEVAQQVPQAAGRACAGSQRVALPSLNSHKLLPSTPQVLQTRLSLISSLISSLSPLAHGAALGQASGCQYQNLIHPASAQGRRQRPKNPQGHRGFRLEVPRPCGQFKPENLMVL